MGDISIEYAKYITFKDSGPGKTCHTVLVCSVDGKQLLPLLCGQNIQVAL
jgi:hypothetical protein